MDYKYDHSRDFIGQIAARNHVVYEETEKIRRPVSITILSIYLFGSLVLQLFKVPGTLGNPALPLWFKIVAMVSLLFGLGTAIGLWKMRRWALLCYLGYIILVVAIYIILKVSLIDVYVIVPIILFAYMCSKSSLLR